VRERRKDFGLIIDLSGWLKKEKKKSKFWENKWIGEETLKYRFPRLYLTCVKTKLLEVTLGGECLILGPNLEET